MNLIGRLILELIATIFNKSPFDPLKTVVRSFRVWPHDMDINIHLTAARYFSFGDLVRIAWWADNKILWSFFIQGYKGVVNAQEITYIREFTPFSKVTLEAQLICWDEKYCYFEHRYYSGDQLYSIAHARVAMIYKRKVISLNEVFSKLATDIESPPETEVIADWKETLQAKKRQFGKNGKTPD